jgi:hypothetical protein
MFNRNTFHRGMNNVLPVGEIPDGFASYIENLVPNGRGLTHILDCTDLAKDLPRSYIKVYPWTPPYIVSGQSPSYPEVLICFTATTCYLVYYTGSAWAVSAALFTGLSGANVQADCDNIQFVFVDGRSNNRAKRIMINDDSTIYADDKGMGSTYLFPELVSIKTSMESGLGTGIGQGGLFGYCISEVNEFEEEGLPGPTLWVDGYQWMRKGEINSAGEYVYDSILQGSIESISIKHTVSSVHAKRLKVYRCDAYAVESKQPSTIKRLVKSVPLSDNVAAGDEIIIFDSYPAGLIELDYNKDSAPSGDGIRLMAGIAFVANACKQYSYPATIERIIQMTISNQNSLNYINRAIQVDLFDEVVQGTSQPYLPNFYWEAGETFSDVLSTHWSLGGGLWTHSAGIGVGYAAPLIGTRAIVAGQKYNVTYTINDTGAGSITSATLGGTALSNVTNGTHTETVTAGTTATLRFVPSSDFVGSVSATVSLSKDEASIYTPHRIRILDSDFITPLKVDLYPIGASAKYGDGLVVLTRRFARITVPEIPMSSDKIIYIVISSDDLPSDYPNEFNEMATQDDVQDMYSALPLNPVRDEGNIITVSTQNAPVSDAWQNRPSNYRTANKANANFEDDALTIGTDYEVDTTSHIVPFDPFFQGSGAPYITAGRPYYEGSNFIKGIDGTTSKVFKYSNAAIPLMRQGYFSFWLMRKAGQATSKILVTLEDTNDNTDYPTIYLGVHDDGTNLHFELNCHEDNHTTTVSNQVSIVNTSIANDWGKFFILCSWRNIISPTGDNDLNTMELNIVVLDEMSSGAITRIWRHSTGASNGSPFTGHYDIDEAGECHFHYAVEELTFIIRISHFDQQFGDFIESADMIKSAYQLTKMLPLFPTGYIGVDYTSVANSYHLINNIVYDEISTVNDTRPGRISWAAGEQNTYKEIMGIEPVSSATDTEEHGVMLVYYADSTELMPLSGDNKIIALWQNIGLTSRNNICKVLNGVAWKHKDNIYLYSPGGGLKTISRDEAGNPRLTAATIDKFVFDKYKGWLWLIINPGTALAYIYDQATDMWVAASPRKVGSLSTVILPMAALSDGSIVANSGDKTYSRLSGTGGASYLYTKTLGRKLRRFRVRGDLSKTTTIGAKVFPPNEAVDYSLMIGSSHEWTQGSGGRKYTHVSGTGHTATLISKFTPIAGVSYTLRYTLGGTGTVAMTFGGYSLASYLTNGAQEVVIPAASIATTTALTITPDATAVRTIENISIFVTGGGKLIAGVSVNNNVWSSFAGLKGDDIILMLSNVKAIDLIEFEDNL